MVEGTTGNMGLMESIKREIERAQQQAAAQARQAQAAPSAAVRRTAILCCMDQRLRPEAALGIPAGGAVVIRNAGGTVGDEALYSLKAAYDVFGARDFVVMGHADCAFTYDASGQWDASGARAAQAQADLLRARSVLPADATIRAVVVQHLGQNRAIPAEAALNPEPPSGSSAAPASASGADAPSKSSAETNRVGGRLEREKLIRVPPAPPMMPPSLTWEQRNPTAADFQRKVAEMTRSEAEPLHALPDGTLLYATTDTGTEGAGGEALLDHLDARAVIRSIALGEMLDEPKGRRGAARPHPK